MWPFGVIFHFAPEAYAVVFVVGAFVVAPAYLRKDVVVSCF